MGVQVGLAGGHQDPPGSLSQLEQIDVY